MIFSLCTRYNPSQIYLIQFHNYILNILSIFQRVYLRERPHDVPDQEKFLWWIPIVAIKEDKLNFSNTTPVTWMNMNQREIKIENFAKPSSFVIVNPEEIGE